MTYIFFLNFTESVEVNYYVFGSLPWFNLRLPFALASCVCRIGREHHLCYIIMIVIQIVFYKSVLIHRFSQEFVYNTIDHKG